MRSLSAARTSAVLPVISTLPWSSTVMLSAILNALSSSWVTTTMVMRKASRRRRINSSSSAETTGSRPADGSSKNSRRGSMTIARASAARLTMPPDNWLGMRSWKPPRLTTSSLMPVMMRMVCSSRRVCSRKGKATLSPTVMDVNRAPPWNETPMRLRTSSFSRSLARAISTPNNVTVPPAGRLRPSMCLSKVLLPEPEPPMITRISPAFTRKSTPCRMRRRPYQASSFSTSIRGVGVFMR